MLGSTDWAATGAMLQGLGTIVGGLGVIGAAIIGASTFKSWRRQKIAERHLEQAELILTASYKARRALARVRGPMMWAYELSAAEETLKTDPKWVDVADARRQRIITAQAFMNRLQRTKDEQTELDRLQPIARALFGEELERAIEELNREFWLVQVDAESYVDDDGSDSEFSASIRRGMYATSSEKYPDPVAARVEGAIGTIEGVCLPILRLERPPNS